MKTRFYRLLRQIKLHLLLFFVRLLGFRFTWVKSDQDKRIVYHLRYEVYSEEGYINPLQYTDKEFRDKYDEVADSLLVKYKGRPVGTVRVIHHSFIGFPIENLFNINLPGPPQDIVGISRLCIIKDFRRKNFLFRVRLVNISIMAKVYFYSKERGIKIWSFVMPEKLKRSFDNSGVVLKKISEKKLQERHFEERKIIPGYFKNANIHPYFLKIDDI